MWEPGGCLLVWERKGDKEAAAGIATAGRRLESEKKIEVVGNGRSEMRETIAGEYRYRHG